MKTTQLFSSLVFLFVFAQSANAQETEAISNPVRVAFKPPVIVWLSPSQQVSSIQEKKLVIKVGVNSDIRLKNVNLLINGTEVVYGDRASSSPDASKFTKYIECEVELTSGPNEIKIVATNEKDGASVESRSVIVTLPEVIATNTNVHRYYALLIAVEEYTDPAIASLSEPLKDANKLKEVLKSKYTFEDKDITILKNPTFEDLHVVFEELSKKIEPTDLLLIFYAGHGYFDERTNIGYWLPSDAEEKNRAKWFRNSALVENIGAINSKHTLLIADACFSGGIFKTRAPFNNASLDIANMLKRPSRKAMTSGSLTTVPDKSVFMKYLLKALDENNNQYLPSEDLFDDVRISMKNNSDTKPLYGEIQNVGDEGGNFVLIKRN